MRVCLPAPRPHRWRLVASCTPNTRADDVTYDRATQMYYAEYEFTIPEAWRGGLGVCIVGGRAVWGARRGRAALPPQRSALLPTTSVLRCAAGQPITHRYFLCLYKDDAGKVTQKSGASIDVVRVPASTRAPTSGGVQWEAAGLHQGRAMQG